MKALPTEQAHPPAMNPPAMKPNSTDTTYASSNRKRFQLSNEDERLVDLVSSIWDYFNSMETYTSEIFWE